MHKSTHEEHLFQSFQTNNKQFKVAVRFLTGYNGIFNVTNSNKKFYFKNSITDGDDFIQTTILQSAYQIESINNGIKKIISDKVHYSEKQYPFKIKPIFCTLGSIIEISPQIPIISFVFNDSIRNLLGFQEILLYKEYNQSTNPVDITTFDNLFIEIDIAKRLIFKGKRTGIIMNFTMSVLPGYKLIN